MGGVSGSKARRAAGEFAIIVVGVLVALSLDPSGNPIELFQSGRSVN